jgi:para-nitrobenzyl esterase
MTSTRTYPAITPREETMRDHSRRLAIIRSVIAPVTVAAASFVLSAVGIWGAGGLQSSCYVTLPGGDVQGQNFGTSCGFLGVPYAASTAGNNRWRPPQARTPWAPLIIQATAGVPSCPQLQGAAFSGTEDCLFMNIWTRDLEPSEPAPVLVWFPTGGFTNASANFAGSNGRRLAEETGTVVVSPNYRLGPLGFLAHRALVAENPAHPTSGNYGLLDQQAALRWVHDNIRRFGGDPDRVTIAGTSAGGTSVALQLVSAGSGGLYHRAIVQSADRATTRLTTQDQSLATGDAWATTIGCTDPQQVVACMRSKTLNQVLTAIPVGTLQVASPPNRVYWEPIVDGIVIPDQPRVLFEQGAFERVPTIVGVNRDEGWGSFTSQFITQSFPSGVSVADYEDWVAKEFGPHGPNILGIYPAAGFGSPAEAMARIVGDAQFVCEARRVARAIERTRTPTYLYSYEYIIGDLSLDRVLHGVESNILFGNNYIPPIFPNHPLSGADESLHGAMSGYWTRFAATGNPNSDDGAAIHWPAFKHPTGRGRGSDKYFVLDTVIREGLRPREAQCDFFEPLFLRSLLGGLPAWAQ